MEASTIRYLHFIKTECLMWKLPVSWDGGLGEVKLVIGLYKGEDVSEI